MNLCSKSNVFVLGCRVPFGGFAKVGKRLGLRTFAVIFGAIFYGLFGPLPAERGFSAAGVGDVECRLPYP